MKYIVYLTTNLKSKVNGINRIYIGVHKTKNPEIFDGYIGCGCYINQPSTYMYPKTPMQYAVKKYGPSAFKREILFIYDDKKDAYKKEADIVTLDFIKQDHVYNACIGGDENWYLGRTIYQFNLQGVLIKEWKYAIEAYEFYNTPREKFNYAIFDKHPLLDSYWAITNKIDITEYQTQIWGEPKVTHLYSKSGKWLKEFISRKECGEYLGTNESNICSAIKRESLVCNNYYVSDKLFDEFTPKARKQYSKMIFFIYHNYKYIGSYVGKEILPIINEYSWTKVRDCIRNNRSWIKDFYISFTKIEESEVPQKQVGNGISIDVYDKYGNFIETVDSIKTVKKKYKIPASKIKNIQLGDRYFKNWIFKYATKRNSK